MSNDSPQASNRLPIWTWFLPFFLFNIGTWISHFAKILPGVSIFYLPTTLGIVLIHWWGPRILPALYLNALICVPLWDLPFKWAPLYAVPETLTALLSWLLARQWSKTDCTATHVRATMRFAGWGVLIPVLLCDLYLSRQLIWLGDLKPEEFIVTFGSLVLADLAMCLALAMPLFYFATEFLRAEGWALPGPLRARDEQELARKPKLSLASTLLMLIMLGIASWQFPIQDFWFLYAAPVLLVALFGGIEGAIVAMSMLFFFILVLPALTSGKFSATWANKPDQIEIFCNMLVIAGFGLLTGRMVSDLARESERVRKAMRSLELQDSLVSSIFKNSPGLISSLNEHRGGSSESETERIRNAMRSVEMQQRMISAIVENSPAVIFLKTLDGRYHVINKRFEEVVGKNRLEVIGKNDLELFGEAVASHIQANDRQVIERRQASQYEEEVPSPVQIRRYLTVKFPLLETDGSVYALCGISTDVSEITETAEKLRKSEEFLRLALTSANMGTWNWDIRKDEITWSEGVATIMGLGPGEFGGTFASLEKVIHPEDMPVVKKMVQDAMEGKTSQHHVFHRVIHKDKSIHWMEVQGHVYRDEKGAPIRMTGVVADITERRQLEASLLQAQKVESIGRLAGGVAHDFNNLLTSILGFADLLRPKIEKTDAANLCLNRIEESAQRGAELTRQLLGYARRQVAQAVVLNVNTHIAHSMELLKRLIGEDIQLAFVPGTELWNIKADPTQLEQILINLAVNARDAMPSGGQITVETLNVMLGPEHVRDRPDLAPGPYVMFAVTDTGQGIEPELLPKIFDPFFTTKPIGQGTGLGLATCFGIVKQSKGHIAVYSEPGHGTTFKVYLPRTLETVETDSAVAVRKDVSGEETILLVEDDPSIREMVQAALKARGFHVLVAENGLVALEITKGYEGRIDLLITDVVMPKLGGKDLAIKLLAERPGIKVLYTSGYTENAIVHHGVLDEGIHFLQKPYSLESLAQKLRAILDE